MLLPSLHRSGGLEFCIVCWKLSELSVSLLKPWISKHNYSRAWWCMPVIPGCGRWRQKDQVFKPSFNWMTRQSSLDGREPLETTAAAMTRNHNYKNCQPHWEASSVCVQAWGCAVVHYLRQQKDSCQKGLLAFGRQQKRDTSFRVERMGGRKRFNLVVWRPQCEKKCNIHRNQLLAL